MDMGRFLMETHLRTGKPIKELWCRNALRAVGPVMAESSPSQPPAAFRGAAPSAPSAGPRTHRRCGDSGPCARAGWHGTAARRRRGPGSWPSSSLPCSPRWSAWIPNPGQSADAPTVVLSHCWTGNHEIWVPVARRFASRGTEWSLRPAGPRRQHAGTAPISVELLAHDLATVLEATDARGAVLAGHSMGGMSIMSLANHRSDVLHERARAVVLVATSATKVGNYPIPSYGGSPPPWSVRPR